MPKIEKEIELNLTGIATSKHAQVKKEVGDFVINEIIEHLDRGVSPVAKLGKFAALDPKYAKAEKGGRRVANLQLEGDLLDAIQHTSRGNKLKDSVRIFVEKNETDKADGHNQLTSKAKAWAKKKGFPKRRFIPDGRQKFNKDIKDGIDDIINRFERSNPKPEPQQNNVRENQESVTTELDLDIFDDDAVTQALLDELELLRNG